MDLRAYFELTGLDSFEGIGRRLHADGNLGQIIRWRANRGIRGLTQGALTAGDIELVNRLRSWRADGEASARYFDRLADNHGVSAILAWHAPLRHSAPRTPTSARARRKG